MLIFDGHARHVSLAVVRTAKENGGILLCLAPHTSHIYQPMDVRVFISLKSHFQSAAAARCKKIGKAKVSRRHFGKILKVV